MTQPIIPDEPVWGSVEGYLETLREKDAQGWDLYAYAFGIAASTATGPSHSAEERIQRIANLATAMDLVNHPVHFLEPGSDGDDDDQMACGMRFGTAVINGSYTGRPVDVTCPGCRPVADVWADTSCPPCGSGKREIRLMTGCGFKCDDPSRWHVADLHAQGVQ